MKNISLRMQLTALSILLLSVCCVCLTVILNVAANNMANVLDAAPVTLAYVADASMSAPIDAASTAAAVPTNVVNEPVAAMMGPGNGGMSGAETDGVTLEQLTFSQQARLHFLQQSILCMIVVIGIGGILTYFLAGLIMEPLRKLGLRMRSRTAHNLSEQLPLSEGLDEVTELTKSFNQMSLKLDQAFAMQQRFAQSAAHELRTPLAILRTKVDVFRKKAEHTPQEYDNLLNTVILQTNRLSALVQNLLELSASDGVTLDESVDLRAIIDQAAMELTPLAKEKEVMITVEGVKQYAVGSSVLLYRVIFNLMENAIKYNRPGGAVCVMLSEGPMVTVSDTGIGIPNEARELIFEPFYRVDKSRSRQMGGAGLGLATVKAIVEQHGGSIQVCANSGGGSRFTVRLL